MKSNLLSLLKVIKIIYSNVKLYADESGIGLLLSKTTPIMLYILD
jgi:hypothetical protein